MQKTIHQRTTVKPGGKIEITNPDLEPGQDVEIIIRPAPPPSQRRSIVDILAEAPGHRLFKTAKEVDDYIKEERASWDR